MRERPAALRASLVISSESGPKPVRAWVCLGLHPAAGFDMGLGAVSGVGATSRPSAGAAG